MLVVGTMLLRAARTQRARIKPRRRQYGPFLALCAATPLILADIVRHVAQDTGVWPGCGNNEVFSRANSSDPFPASCLWSSSQYRCSVTCCVPTWLSTGAGAEGGEEYAWFPAQRSFFPAEGAAVASQFATIRPDGSLYLPSAFNTSAALEPVRAFHAPLALYAGGRRRYAGADNEPKGTSECPHGRNPATGACYLVDPALPHAEQLKLLPQRDGQPTCDCDLCTHAEDMSHLSPMGLVFTILCTYSGFALLALAVLWNANIVAKLRHVGEEWRALRAEQQRRNRMADP
mmetsp:Transcript_16281/g.42187  ORF Transcript_16281/g.42187 Transcript_16281/m.42187 type:complete len:289 (+) Transcript_16281:472-1338(+)